jgi:adenine phosphoribosyltransferase
VGEPTLTERVRSLVRDVPDYPRAGVMFKDITPLLADGPTFGAVVTELADRVRPLGVDLVAGMEARGFILGAPVAAALGVGFVPVRKAGKLPGPTLTASFVLEYGSATVEIHPDTIPAGARVLVLDDVLATGGTAAATAGLIERAGGVVVGTAFLLEVAVLAGRERLDGRHVDVLLVDA